MDRRTELASAGSVVAAGAGATWLGARDMGLMADYEAAVAKTRTFPPSRHELVDLVRYATRAPNGHNTQPWRFRLAEGRIDVAPDLSRRTPVLDPDDHHLFVSLGCVAENLALAGAARDLPGEVAFNPTGVGGLTFAYGGGQPAGSALFDAIARRQTQVP